MELSSQSAQSGRGKIKRFWKRDEEDFLVNALLELSNDPEWKAEGNFKNGFLLKLEAMLNEKCPGSGLKAMPHIDSKYKWLKDKYNVINEMLRTSGFQWDDTNKMIKCERQAYEEFCKKNHKAQGLWKVSFPWLEQLDGVFGVDRARGDNVETFHAAVENMQIDPINLENDEENSDGDEQIREDESVNDVDPSPPLAKKAKKEKTPKGKDKRKMPEVIDLTTSFNNISSDFLGFMKDVNTHLSTIATAMSTTQQHEQALMIHEQEVMDQKKNVLTEVARLPGLSRYEALKAAKMLASDQSNLDIFFQSPDDEWKKDFVLNLLYPDLPPSSDM